MHSGYGTSWAETNHVAHLIQKMDFLRALLTWEDGGLIMLGWRFNKGPLWTSPVGALTRIRRKRGGDIGGLQS